MARATSIRVSTSSSVTTSRPLSRTREQMGQDIAAYIEKQVKKYPPRPAGSQYRRTGEYGKNVHATASLVPKLSINVRIDVPYWKMVETGVGLYGPKKRVLKPKNAQRGRGRPVLVWRSYGAGVRQKLQKTSTGITYKGGKVGLAPARNTYRTFAKSSPGYKGWAQVTKVMKSDGLKREIQRAMAESVSNL